MTPHLTNELNWSSSAQQFIQRKETEERYLSHSASFKARSHIVAAHLHGFTPICQTLPPGFTQWPWSRRFDWEGGWADFNCLLSGGYNCTWRGDEPCYAVTAVILLFFPVPLAAIKSHDGLLGGLRGAQL